MDFYQIGCIALWEASLKFNEEKGEFKSYAYSYMVGRMIMALTAERKKKENESQVEDISFLQIVPEQVAHDLVFLLYMFFDKINIFVKLTLHMYKYDL